MARYKLMIKHPEDDDEEELKFFRKTTRAQVNQWCEDNTRNDRLDWRVGYMLKFKGDKAVYTWRRIKDNSALR